MTESLEHGKADEYNPGQINFRGRQKGARGAFRKEEPNPARIKRRRRRYEKDSRIRFPRYECRLVFKPTITSIPPASNSTSFSVFAIAGLPPEGTGTGRMVEIAADRAKCGRVASRMAQEILIFILSAAKTNLSKRSLLSMRLELLAGTALTSGSDNETVTGSSSSTGPDGRAPSADFPASWLR